MPDRPKISYIAGSKVPSREANSIHVMKMCQALKQEAYDVTLYIPGTKTQAADYSTLWQHYGIKEPFAIQYIPSKMKSLALSHLAFGFRSATDSKNQRSQYVYSRHLHAAMFSSLRGLPTVYEMHSVDPGGKMSWLYLRLLIRGKGFKKLVVISEALKKLILQKYPDIFTSENTIVAHDGVDLERFSQERGSRRNQVTPDTGFVAGYIGHLYPGRGIELIFELARRQKGITFWLIGGMEQDIQRWKSELAQNNLPNVRIFGFVSNSDLPRIMSECDVLLMPYQKKVFTVGGSDSSKWMSPLKMFEYMASGRPIISSRLPVLLEVLTPDNAILCDPDDIKAWQSALEKVLNEPEWAQKLGCQAQLDVQKFAWRSRVRMVMESIRA
jgi:glycosyltransferase involved in cell wall biosynthesis